MEKEGGNNFSESEIIRVDEKIYLSEPMDEDIPSFIAYLNEEEMYHNTLKIPKPYLEKDGKWFVNFCRERKKIYKRTMEWGIRNENNELIGCIGLLGNNNESPHRDIIGYWLAKPFWNRKIMSCTVIAFCEYVMLRDKLVRVEAHVYPHNIPSCRLLERAGFVKEGLMEKFIFKDGNYLDCFLYALVK